MSDLYARDSVASLKSRELVNETQRQAGSIDPNNLNETDEIITYVLVLHDTSKSLQELSFAPIGKTPSDALAEHLKPAFGGNTDSVNLNLFQKQAAIQLGSSDATVSEEALQKVAKEGNVPVAGS
jgi:hypothetical protein